MKWRPEVHVLWKKHGKNSLNAKSRPRREKQHLHMENHIHSSVCGGWSSNSSRWVRGWQSDQMVGGFHYGSCLMKGGSCFDRTVAVEEQRSPRRDATPLIPRRMVLVLFVGVTGAMTDDAGARPK
jgi:hypothetical protein